MANLQLFAPVKSRAGLLTRDAYMKNVFAEPNGEEGMYIYKRPGLALYSTNSAGTAQGLTSYRDPDDVEYLFQVNGGTLYNASGKAPEADASTKQSFITVTPNYPTTGCLAAVNGILYSMHSNAARTRFIVWYSTDGGANWTALLDQAADGSTYPLGFGTAKACAHNGKILLVLDSFGGYDTWESADGVTWTKLDDAWGTGSIEHVVSHLGNLYLFTQSATDPVLKSTDNGATWASAGANPGFEGPGGRFYYGACSDGTYLYVMGGSTGATNSCQKVYRSTDGVTWNELGTDVLSEVITSTSAGNGVNVAVYSGVFYLYENADSGSAVAKVWVSGDAQVWTLAATLQTSLTHSTDDITPTVGGNNFNVMAYAISRGRINILWYDATNTFGTYLTYHNFSHELVTPQAPLAAGTVGIGKLDFSQNYSRTALAVKSSSAAFTISVPGGILASVTDVDYPATTVRGLVYLDGYFFVMDTDGNIWQSAAEDFTSWSALAYIAAEFEPDGGVALAKYENYVVAFGNYTTEFFYDAGNASGSVLSPVQNGVMSVGCPNGDTVQTIESQIFFVAQTKSGGQAPATGKFVAKLSGTSYEKLSTPDIDRLLDADDFADVDACTFKVGGHSYYHLRLGTSNISLVFDVSQSQWYVWDTRRTSFTNTMASVVTASGTATWTGTHSFADGDQAVITAFTGTHTALNGTFNVNVPGTNTTTLLWSVGTAYSGTSTGTGTATGYSADDFPVAYACDFEGAQLLQDKSNGNLYTLSGATYQDNSVYIDYLIRTEKTDGKTNNAKFAAYADFISDRASGNVLMRHSDDDCQTWTKYRARSLAGQRTRWSRLGSFRRRTFEFRVTDNIPVRAERLELQATDDEASANG